MNNIIFGHLGFASTDVFVLKDGRQLMVGTLQTSWKENQKYDFWPYNFCMEHYVKRRGYLTAEEIPTVEQITVEYERQLAERGVSINNEILYAG